MAERVQGECCKKSSTRKTQKNETFYEDIVKVNDCKKKRNP